VTIASGKKGSDAPFGFDWTWKRVMCLGAVSSRRFGGEESTGEVRWSVWVVYAFTKG